MANVTEIWTNPPSRTLGHNCEVCGKNYRIRYKRKYRDLCGSCAIGFAQTNALRKKRGQKPMPLAEYKITHLVKKIYKILGNIKTKSEMK